MSEGKSVRIEKYHFARNSEMLNHPKSEGQRERILATGDWTVSLVAAGEGLQAAGRPTEEKQSVNKQADKERTTGTTNPRSSSLLWLAKPNWELDHFPSKKMLKMAGRRSGGAGRRHPSVYPFHSSAYSLIRWPVHHWPFAFSNGVPLCMSHFMVQQIRLYAAHCGHLDGSHLVFQPLGALFQI